MILTLSLVNIILNSCSVKQKEQNDILVSNVAFSEGFTVNVLVTAKMDDIFDMFYALDSLDEKFTESNKIRKVIKGTGEPELISFLVDRKNVLKFRIDLGRNLDQKSIVIDRIDIRCDGKSIIIPGNILEHFFTGNKYLEFSENGNTIYIDRKGGTKTPFITSSALLNKKMKIEFQ